MGKKLGERGVATLLLMALFLFWNRDWSLLTQVYAKETEGYNTTVSQTIDGITWLVYGAVNVADEKHQMSWIDPKSSSYKIVIQYESDWNGEEIVIPDAITNGTNMAEITYFPEELFEEKGIRSLTLNSHITEIPDRSFVSYDKLESVKGKDTVVDIGEEAFANCSSLTSAELPVGNVGDNAFAGTNVQDIRIGKSSRFQSQKIGKSAFADTGLQTLQVAASVSRLTLGPSAFYNTNLQRVAFPGEVHFYGTEQFKNCPKLCAVDFYGDVDVVITDKQSFCGIFENSFSEGEGEKSVIFHRNAELSSKLDLFTAEICMSLPSYTNSSQAVFGNCSGLTKVQFLGETTLPSYCFYGCESLQEVSFGSGDVVVGNYLFEGCQKLEELTFHSSVKNEAKYAQVFWGSSLKNVYFYDYTDKESHSVVDLTLGSNNKGIPCDLYFGTDQVSGRIYGTNHSIVFFNPNTKDIFLEDLQSEKHIVAGYSSKNSAYQHVEQWIKDYSEQGEFTSLIEPGSFQVEPIERFGAVRKSELDFQNLAASAIGFGEPKQRYAVSCATGADDRTGYLADPSSLPDTMTAGAYTYPVTYGGQTILAKIWVKEITGIEIVWNEKRLWELVENEPVTIADVVSEAKLCYNDSSRKKLEDLSRLKLNLDRVKAGENVLRVTYLDQPEIYTSYTCTIRENKIVGITARYTGNSVQVGETIDMSRIQITPFYQYPELALQHTVQPTSVSPEKIPEDGVITVCYNDQTCKLTVPALPMEVDKGFTGELSQSLPATELPGVNMVGTQTPTPTEKVPAVTLEPDTAENIFTATLEPSSAGDILTATLEPKPTEDVLSATWKPKPTEDILTATLEPNSAGNILTATLEPNSAENVLAATPEPEKDKTPPTTNIKKKVYTANVRIRFSDSQSGIQSAVLSGKEKKQISSGYLLKKEGSYTLTIWDRAGNKKKVAFVLAKPAKSIAVSYSFTKKWNRVQFKGSAKGTQRKPAWSVSGKKVGKITKNGLFQAKKSGTCYVIASLDKKRVKKKLVVNCKDRYILVYT